MKSNPIRHLSRSLLFIAWLVPALSGCIPGPRHPLDAAGEAEAREADAILGIRHPYAFRRCDVYRDGGTVGIELMDSRGRRIAAAADGRMRSDPDSVLRAQSLADSFWIAPRHFYLGAAYPDRKGAVELPIRGRVEMGILDALDVVSLQEFGRARRDSLLEQIDANGSWSPELRRLDESEARALRAARMARGRRRMDPRGSLIVTHITPKQRAFMLKHWAQIKEHR